MGKCVINMKFREMQGNLTSPFSKMKLQYYSIEGNKFYIGCCLDLMDRMDDNSVDLIFTDPPYRMIAGGKPKSPTTSASCKKYKTGWHTSDVTRENNGMAGLTHNHLEFYDYMSDFYRILKPGSHCYIMVNTTNLRDLITSAEQAGFVFINLLIWEKNNSVLNRYYMKNTELVCLFYKKPAKTINFVGSKQIYFCNNPTGKLHPNEKPVELIRHYIENSTDEGDLVFDPFAGSGSTAIAAMQSKCKWLTCEKDVNHASNALARIRTRHNLIITL